MPHGYYNMFKTMRGGAYCSQKNGIATLIFLYYHAWYYQSIGTLTVLNGSEMLKTNG